MKTADASARSDRPRTSACMRSVRRRRSRQRRVAAYASRAPQSGCGAGGHATPPDRGERTPSGPSRNSWQEFSRIFILAGHRLHARRRIGPLEFLLLELMRGMQEGAAATGRDVLALAFDVARIMMAVAGEHGAQAMILLGKIGKARQVGEVRESRFGILGVDIGPARLAGADDQARTGVHPFADSGKNDCGWSCSRQLMSAPTATSRGQGWAK